MFLQSMQSAPPTLRASQYEVPIDSMTISQTRPSLGYMSVQFTSCPATLEDVPTQESHMYESVQCVQNTTRSEEDVEQSVGEVVAHPQPTSPESDYELMESARYYREEISHGEEERMNDGKDEGEMRHEEETRHHMATSVEVSCLWWATSTSDVTSVSPLSRCKVMTSLSVMLHLQHVCSGRHCHNSIMIPNILYYTVYTNIWVTSITFCMVPVVYVTYRIKLILCSQRLEKKINN